MSAFAAGERYINRVWSASTDGYEDEVRTYLGRARHQFAEAAALFRRLRRESATCPMPSGGQEPPLRPGRMGGGRPDAE